MNCLSLTDEQLKGFIVRTLTLADPCAEDLLSRAIGELWAIAGWSTGCNERLIRYFQTRLISIELLMSCAAKLFDTADRLDEHISKGRSNARSDSTTQAQASNQGFRVNDSCATAHYDDFAKAKMRSGSQRDSKSCSSDTSFSNYTDVGSGRNRAKSDATRMSGNTVLTRSNSSSRGSSVGGSSRAGCNWTFSTERGASSSNSLSFAGTVLFASAGAGLGQSASYSTSSWAHHMDDATSSRQVDVRNGKSFRTYGREGATHNRSNSESCSFFQAAVLTVSAGTSQSRGADDSSAFRDEHAHAEGAGESFSKADARSEVTAQGTARGHSDADSKRDSDKLDRTLADTIKLSQRFANLKALHELTLQNLQYLHAVNDASRTPLYSEAICELYRDGACDVRMWMYTGRNFSACTVLPNGKPVIDCCGDDFCSVAATVRADQCHTC